MSKIPFVKLTTYDDKAYYLTQKQAVKVGELMENPDESGRVLTIADDKVRVSSIKSLEQTHLQLNDIPKYLAKRIQKDYPKSLADGGSNEEGGKQYEWRRYWEDDPKCAPYQGQRITRKQIENNCPKEMEEYEPADALIDKQHLPYVCKKHEVTKAYVTDPNTGKQTVATNYGKVVEALHVRFELWAGTWHQSVRPEKFN